MTNAGEARQVGTFLVEISGTNSPVEGGESLVVELRVENNGEETATQGITLAVGGVERDRTAVTLENGQSTGVKLTWETGPGDSGEYTATVASDDDDATETVTVEAVNAPPTVDISQEPTEPSTGEGVSFTAEASDPDGSVESYVWTVDGETVSRSVGFGYVFEAEGNHTVAVTVTDDGGASTTASRTVSVNAPPDVSIAITGTNSPVTEGESLFVDVSVQNLKGGTVTQTIIGGLVDPRHDDTPVDNAADIARVVLEPEGTEDVTLEIGQGHYREGNEAKYEKKIWAGLADEADSTAVTVRKPPRFDVEVDSTNGPVEEGERLEVQATVENTGGEAGTYAASLDGFGLASEGNRSARKGRNPQTGKEIKIPAKKVTKFKPGAELSDKIKKLDTTGSDLAPGESETVTLVWDTEQGDSGDYALAAQTQAAGVGDLDGDGDLDAFVATIGHGPMRTGRFEVQIDGEEVGGWQSVTIPGRSVEQDEYRESNDGPGGRTSFDDLEMERGVKPGDVKLHDWFEDVRAGSADAARKEISVKMQDEEGEAVIQFNFTDAWIKSYEPPELDASADGDVATESITVAYDRMKREEV